MTNISFAKTGDEHILGLVETISNTGVDVTVQTTESNGLGRGEVQRMVVITWTTYNPDARVIS